MIRRALFALAMAALPAAARADAFSSPPPSVIVQSVHTGSGAIAVGDSVAVANCASACTLTLPAAGSVLHGLTVKQAGAGAVTISGTIDGTPAASIVLAAGGAGAEAFVWSAALASWLSSGAVGAAASGGAGGDLSGTYPAPTVAKIGGVSPAAIATSGSASDLVTGTVAAARLPAPVLSVYTGTGTVSAGDSVALANCSSACTLTLPAGGAAVQMLVVKQYGAGAVTVTGNIDGAGSATTTLVAVGIKPAQAFTWAPSLSTWLMN